VGLATHKRRGRSKIRNEPRLTPKEKGFGVDVWMQFNASSRRFAVIEFAVAPTWTFNRTLFARLQLDAPIGLWNVDGQRTWRDNLTLGPALGVNVWRANNGAVTDITAAVGRSLDNKEWSYAYYDLGVETHRRGILTGIGVRHYDSKHSAFRDRTSLYVKLGFRF